MITQKILIKYFPRILLFKKILTTIFAIFRAILRAYSAVKILFILNQTTTLGTYRSIIIRILRK